MLLPVDARIVEALRRRSVDIITAADSDLLGVSDEQQLARAVELGRPIVSADRDFLALVHAHLKAGAVVPGLILILDPTDMRNTIEWVL